MTLEEYSRYPELKESADLPKNAMYWRDYYEDNSFKKRIIIIYDSNVAVIKTFRFSGHYCRPVKNLTQIITKESYENTKDIFEGSKHNHAIPLNDDFYITTYEAFSLEELETIAPMSNEERIKWLNDQGFTKF